MKRGFNRGLGEAKARDQVAIRSKIMEKLGINNRVSFYQRRDGVTSNTPAEEDAIEAIFNEHGVPASKVWDNEKPKRKGAN